MIQNCPKLMLVAIQAGAFLACWQIEETYELCQYLSVSLYLVEYSCICLLEGAIKKYGAENIEVDHMQFMLLLKCSLSHEHGQQSQMAYTKVVLMDKSSEQNVIGIHFVGPNAGEGMQGFGTAANEAGAFF